MSAEFWIGIDLGATNIKAVAVSSSGEIFEQLNIDTLDDSTARWAPAIKELISDFERKRGASAAGIGLAAPGLAARDERSIAFMPGRMAGLERFDWTNFLGRAQIVSVLNDAHASLLGEVWLGAASGCRDAFLLTLGTGVGGAILTDGKLLRGNIGRGGHLGHISLDSSGVPDIVGTPGSLEDAIGECTLEKRSRGRFKTTSDLVAAHLKNDSNASAIWMESLQKLATGIVSLINVLDPERVIIGGGIAKAGPALFNPLREMVQMSEWRPGGHRVEIVPAELGNWAGAVGAAYSAFNKD